MRDKYEDTEKLGDQRTRSQKQTVVSPNGGTPSVEICEQRIILAENEKGEIVEQVLKELPAFSVDVTPEMMSIEIPEIGLDYKPTGRMITVAQAFSSYATFVRWCQIVRDLSTATPSPGE
jgi:hypothetical protein